VRAMAQEQWQVEVRKIIRAGFHGSSSKDLEMMTTVVLPFVPFIGLQVTTELGADVLLEHLHWIESQNRMVSYVKDDMTFYNHVRSGGDEPSDSEVLAMFNENYEPHGWEMVT